jgi:Na+:H+ antiporter, NhaA family
MLTKAFRYFVSLESSSGLLLLACAASALLITNSPLNDYYQHLLLTHLSIGFGKSLLSKPLVLWINEGLMAIFFLLVSIEIRREITLGELSIAKQRVLPMIGALGGMIVPACIYLMIVPHETIAMRGWAIPTATDIAFSLAILSLFGKRLPHELKIFLTALAILDDLGAIIIIALFYTSQISFIALGISLVLIICLFILNQSGVDNGAPYYLIAILLWFAILKSGVHATFVGVILAFTLPMANKVDKKKKLALKVEHTLAPWVSFLILPIFAFANSGVPLANMHHSEVIHSIPLAIICGLLIGKPLGIFSSCLLAVKLKLTSLPKHVNWSHMFGISALCGIGFTMSIFIGSLAFETHAHHGAQETVQLLYANRLRIGVLVGSILSGLLGYVILYMQRSPIITKPNSTK